ncbi:MAG: hypothetical protein CL565_02045 [Alphaproteobacteria bacterium]|nr:hypothetical protein [Alphaproteobacteria bacterium]|tara:strand:- start:1285 stop:1677 length:393 start_codon:yes stop_codon:yes gene_type:complete
MAKLQKPINAIVVLSELSHIFCCGLPALFSFLSLLSGLGVSALMPSSFETLHHFMHEWEVPMLMVSGFILVVGWVLHKISKNMDCVSDGCAHPPCGPVKKKSNKVLVFATLLYLGNLVFYTTFHSDLSLF